MEYWIGTMVSLMAVCAVFVTITPIANNYFRNKHTKQLKSLEKHAKELETRLQNQQKEINVIYQSLLEISIKMQ